MRGERSVQGLAGSATGHRADPAGSVTSPDRSAAALIHAYGSWFCDVRPQAVLTLHAALGPEWPCVQLYDSEKPEFASE